MYICIYPLRDSPHFLRRTRGKARTAEPLGGATERDAWEDEVNRARFLGSKACCFKGKQAAGLSIALGFELSMLRSRCCGLQGLQQLGEIWRQRCSRSLEWRCSESSCRICRPSRVAPLPSLSLFSPSSLPSLSRHPSLPLFLSRGLGANPRGHRPPLYLGLCVGSERCLLCHWYHPMPRPCYPVYPWLCSRPPFLSSGLPVGPS